MNKKIPKHLIVCLFLIQIFLLVACGPEEARRPTITPFPLKRNTPVYQPLVEALKPVLQGQGVPGAAAFTPLTGEGIHPLVIIMDINGEPYDKWNEDLPPEWVPTSLEEVELVVYVNQYDSSRNCGSASYSGGVTVIGVCVDTDVQVLEAKSGKIVKQWAFKSAPPGFPSIVVEGTRIQRSVPILFADFWEWFTGEDGISCMLPFCIQMGQEEWLDDLAFSPDGQVLAAGMAKGQHFSGEKVRLWRVSDLELLSTLEGLYSKNFVFSPDGLTLASGYSYAATLFHVEDGQQLFRLEGHKDQVRSLAFSPDGQILVSGSGCFENENIRLWDVSNGQQLRALVGHQDSVECFAFSPDGQILASGGGGSCNIVDNTVRLWRVSDGELLYTLEGHTAGVESVAYSPDGQILASGGKDTSIRLWSAADGTLLHTLYLQIPVEKSNGLIALSFSSDGQSLLAIDFNGNAYRWRVEDGALLKTYEALFGQPIYEGYQTIFSPDGQTLAYSNRKSIRFYPISELLGY